MGSEVVGEKDPWRTIPKCICKCTHPKCECRIGATRDTIASMLQQISRKDLNDERNVFIPRGAMINHFTHDRILLLLKILLGHNPNSPSTDKTNIEDLATYISPGAKGCYCGDPSCTGARALFFALVFIAKEEQVDHFYQEAKKRMDSAAKSWLCDRSLGPHHATHDPTQALESIHFTKTWDPYEKDAFWQSQWRMKSPIFKLPSDPTKFDVLNLNNEVSLPWVKLEPLKSEKAVESNSNKRSKKGGQFATVMKLKIHRDHHEFDPTEEFALKKFEKSLVVKLHGDRFKDEIKANERLGHPHDRIVPLLAAFRHRDTHYLLFPWAGNGTLKDIWKQAVPADLNTSSEPCFSIDWLLDECRGLADGLAFVHGQQAMVSQLHADISPENILGFPTQINGITKLKLADFGLSRKAEADDKIGTRGLPHDLTYSPPEGKLKEEIASLKWDIWCLGCLYLDFITCSLLGYDGMKTGFTSAREDEQDTYGTSRAQGKSFSDRFFVIYTTKPWLAWVPGYHAKTSAKVKRSVCQHIKDLQAHNKCNDPLRKFLEYIGQNMIVVDVSRRASAVDVGAYLKELRPNLTT